MKPADLLQFAKMQPRFLAHKGSPTNLPALEQINAEVFALTYGSIIRQLLADLEDLAEVNKQLEKM